MLVLQRRVRQRILIGGNITVEVIDCGRDRIKLGVVAPRDVPVFREELLSDEERDALPNLVVEGDRP